MWKNVNSTSLAMAKKKPKHEYNIIIHPEENGDISVASVSREKNPTILLSKKSKKTQHG